jgi:hypothetical protein
VDLDADGDLDVAVANQGNDNVSVFRNLGAEAPHSQDDDNDGIPDECGCYADCEQDGDLDVDDFICFQTIFAVGLGSADCEGDGDLDIDDFVCFQTFFALGCG